MEVNISAMPIGTGLAPRSSQVMRYILSGGTRSFKPGEHFYSADTLPEGAVFALPNGRQFKKGALRRNRFLCRDLGNGREYCVAGLAEVRVLG